MHDYLLSIWHKHCNPVVLRVLFKTPLGLLNLKLDLLKAAKVDFVQNFCVDLLKVLFLELYLVRNRLELLLETVRFLLVDGNVLHLVTEQASFVAERDLLGQRLTAHVLTG